MEIELKICNDYSSKEFEREPTREDLNDLSLALKQHFGDERVQQNDWGILVRNFSESEMHVVRERARQFKIPIACGVSEELTKAELCRVAFARLTVTGDLVDMDSDGNPLNEFPKLLCSACKMPDESALPNPFRVSSKQMFRQRQDGVPNYSLPTHREIFWSNCGVFVVADRVRQILEALGQSFNFAPVELIPSRKLPCDFWAIRAANVFGMRKYILASERCPACNHPQYCHIDTDSEIQNLWGNRIILESQQISKTEFVNCETWFGDRRKQPFGFTRDVFISGRLYEVLLRAKIRGLLSPENFIAFENEGILFAEEKSTRDWIDSGVESLKLRNLL